MKNKHIIVVDPTAFSGGSKVATESILELLDPDKFKITILTADRGSWKNQRFAKFHLYEPSWLAQKEQGVSYFIRHAFIAVQLLLLRIRLGQFDLAIGASGPGVDLSLYLLRLIMKYKVIQLIHGPVALSRTIKRCLLAAQQVHYLKSSAPSLRLTLGLQETEQHFPKHFHLLSNGLSRSRWPSSCQMDYPRIFWAASLLKWKGLDTLLEAIEKMPAEARPTSQICYIEPKGVQLPVSNAPRFISNVNWFNNPFNLDEVRASANIFVSTSDNEPFGLSILEALAAGQCVVIPADGAYWDKVLTDRYNCIKYKPSDVTDLHDKLLMLTQFMPLISRIGENGARLAQNYQANKQYQNIVQHITDSTFNSKHKSTLLRVNL